MDEPRIGAIIRGVLILNCWEIFRAPDDVPLEDRTVYQVRKPLGPVALATITGYVDQTEAIDWKGYGGMIRGAPNIAIVRSRMKTFASFIAGRERLGRLVFCGELGLSSSARFEQAFTPFEVTRILRVSFLPQSLGEFVEHQAVRDPVPEIGTCYWYLEVVPVVSTDIGSEP
jgi:hypothetical protein